MKVFKQATPTHLSGLNFLKLYCLKLLICQVRDPRTLTDSLSTDAKPFFFLKNYTTRSTGYVWEDRGYNEVGLSVKEQG